MSKIKDYLEDASNELFHKVSWPTLSELQSSSVVVMITSVIIAMIVFGMDRSFNFIMEQFYHIFQ